MLIGMIRPTSSSKATLEGTVQADVRADLEAQTPAGFELTDAVVTMEKRSIDISVEGTYLARTVEEIEAEDMAALRAKVPEGWQLLNVRAV